MILPQRLFYKAIWMIKKNDMAKKQSTSCLRSFILIILLSGCIILVSGVAMIETLPAMATREFGPPSASLTLFQRAFYSLQLLLQRDNLVSPANLAGKPQTFRIQAGESVNLIALHLEDAGLIKNAGAFRLYLIYSGADTRLQSGDFTLSPDRNAIQIAKMLQDAGATDITLTILAGWRKEEIALAVAGSGLSIKAEEFLRGLDNLPKEMLPEAISKLSDLEGFLFPGIYHFKRSATLTDVISTLTQAFDNQVNNELRQAFQKQGLSLYQAVTLASIVQREAMAFDEQPIIASVFYNRLRIGMKLDSDPTVQYAAGYNTTQKTWWTNPLSQKELRIDSPYNTYIFVGLPPTPIASPGLEALRAVAYPAQTPYFYFQAKCDGTGRHNFAVTYDEHLRNSCP